MSIFSKDDSFKDLIKKNERAIICAAESGMETNDHFKVMLSLTIAMLAKYRQNEFKVIVINESDLQNLTNEASIRIETLFKCKDFLENRHIVVDSNLNIIDKDNDKDHGSNNDIRRVYTEMSKSGCVIFLLSSEGTINYFVDGRDAGDSIFYKRSTLNEYNKKRPLSELKEVLAEYRQRLKHRDTYSKFFVEKSHLKSLRIDIESELDENKFVELNKQLLRNKPEDSFRDDLRMFLKEKMKVNFASKEAMLESMKRLDIVMLDQDGEDLYFIEVKWVGKSIHETGKKIGTSYTASHVMPNAFVQSASYITELIEEGVNLKIGYLAVFDARDEALPDTGKGMTIDKIPEKNRKEFYRFEKLDDFRVVNEHPC